MEAAATAVPATATIALNEAMLVSKENRRGFMRSKWREYEEACGNEWVWAFLNLIIVRYF